jgi:hypothetical protein
MGMHWFSIKHLNVSFYFKVKAEQKQKAEENFSEWKELKNKQRQQCNEQQRQKKLENNVGEDFR